MADLDKRSDVAPLGSLITHIQYGASLKPKYASEGIPFLRITNLKPNELDTSKIVYFPESQRKAIGTCFVREGDILISRSGTIGIAAAVPGEADGFAFGSYTIKFSVSKEVNPFYVAAFINSAYGKAQIERATSGAVQRNITIPGIKAIKIPLLQRHVQDRVAQMVSEAYREHKEKLAQVQRLIASIDGYVLGRLGVRLPRAEARKWYIVSYSQLNGRWDAYHYQPIFTQVVKGTQARPSGMPLQKLGEIITSLAGGATPRVRGEAYTDKDHGIPFLRIQNVTEAGIDLSDVEYITQETHNGLLRRSQLRPGDLLMTITGRVGTAAVVPASLHEANINQHMVRMKLKEGINPWYVAAFLNSELGRSQTQRAVTGTTRIALDYTAIRGIEILLPPCPVQDEVAAEVASRREQASRLRQEAEHVLATAMENVERIVRGGKQA